MPERQNSASSTWWFFLLFPEGPDGYGPRQLMFTIATRAGGRMRIADVPLQGFDPHRSLAAGIDRFEAAAVGWYSDGRGVYDDYLRHAGPAVLDLPGGSLTCAAHDQPEYAMTFRTPRGGRPTLAADIRGPGGSASFETWGDLDATISSPVVSMDITTPFGGTHYIGWRRLNFRGRFDLPDGPETLQGIGFFPVSYTHLDVYKRQVTMGAWPSKMETTPQMSEMARITRTAAGILSRNSM